MQAAEDGRITVESIDKPLSIEMRRGNWVLPDRVLDTQDDFILVCQNLVQMAYGAAAITLNKCREEAGVRPPVVIRDECDEWVALVYQIRNAFAHDIAEPRWAFSNAASIRTRVSHSHGGRGPARSQRQTVRV
jgi:hypothetical protein